MGNNSGKEGNNNKKKKRKKRKPIYGLELVPYTISRMETALDLFSDEPQIIQFDEGDFAKLRPLSHYENRLCYLPNELKAKVKLGEHYTLFSCKSIRGTNFVNSEMHVGCGFPYRQSLGNYYPELAIFGRNVDDFFVMGDFRNATGHNYMNLHLRYGALFVIMCITTPCMVGTDEDREKGQERESNVIEMVGSIVQTYEIALEKGVAAERGVERVVVVIDGGLPFKYIRFKESDMQTNLEPTWKQKGYELPVPHDDATWKYIHSLDKMAELLNSV